MKKIIFLMTFISSFAFGAEVCEFKKHKIHYDLQCSNPDMIQKFISEGLIGFKSTDDVLKGFVVSDKKMDAIKLMLNNGYDVKENHLFIKK